MDNLIETYLVEADRKHLINKSRKGKHYSKKPDENRWTAKGNVTVANSVKDYNKVDMDTFWKKDKLIFGVRIKGESDDYIVTVEFDGILPKIQSIIRENKNLLEVKCIYKALVEAINTKDIKVDCSCPDFKYRFAYAASEQGYKSGEKETRAAKITNPDDDLGAACKHVLNVLNNADWVKKIASVINNYANYCKDNLLDLYSRYIFPKLYGMPYQKAVQLTAKDFDADGNLKDKLDTDEATINLANALGKNRGKIQKGSNKNPVAQQRRKEAEDKEGKK